MRRIRWGTCATALLVLGSCDGGGIGLQEARLRPVLGCGELEQAIRTAALAEMEASLAANLALAKQGCSYGGESRNGVAGMPAPSAAAGDVDSASSGGGASQVSTTNNQVVGVDEADFIKNDNTYLYLAANGAFRIVRAWPPTEAKEIAKVAVEGTPKKLFVKGDRALVYSSLTSSSSSGASGWSGRECTYGYNCSFTGDGNPTKISIFDISDRSAPVLIRELKLSGSYVNARRIGRGVHTVLSAPGVKIPGLASWPSDLPRCSATSTPAAADAAFARLREQNRQKIMETSLSALVPSVSDRILGAGGAVLAVRDDLLGSCRGFYAPSRSRGGSFTTLLSLDLESDAPVGASTIVSEPGAVYASPKALYLAVPQQRGSDRGWYASLPSAPEVTLLHKFELAAEGSYYLGSGLVKGRVLNQFAMDEHQDHLRVATTTGRLPSKDVHSTLSVLGPGMIQTGVLDQLAPGEDIRSVRFDGARGFVVTFKKTDPLFVFDLSSPYSPRALAELKIPGFSTYMHLMDRDHLLTIGYDANDQGSFAWFTGVLLQIFDVSNPLAPTLTHKEVIGTRGSSSEALTNHLAFTYFAPKQLLALPMTVCEGGSGKGSYGTTMSFSGLMVYDVTPATGFKLTGKVEHAKAGASCHNWWTNASSTVKRSIVMDDYVFSVTDEVVKANHLANLPVDVAAIPIR